MKNQLTSWAVRKNNCIYGIYGKVINSNNDFILYPSSAKFGETVISGIFWRLTILRILEMNTKTLSNIALSDKLGYAAITNNSQIFMAYSYKDSFFTHITYHVGVMLKK